MSVRFGPYEIVGELGSGGMGVVHRAHHAQLGREVALKLLKPDCVSTHTLLARFRREIQRGINLQHPNLVRVLDGGTVGDVPYLAMELVEGHTLDQVVVIAQRLHWALALAVVAQILDGVGYLHEQGILHRDIKAANVLVSKQGEIKLSDLGLITWKEATVLTSAGAVVGTISYMAPEVLQDEAMTQASDLWAVGVIFYQLLTGRMHVPMGQTPELLSAILHARILPPRDFVPGIPEAVDQLSQILLDRDPVRRGDDARRIRKRCDELLDALAGTTTEILVGAADFRRPETLSLTPARIRAAILTPPPMSEVTEVIRPASRGRSLALALGVLAALGVAGWASRSPRPPYDFYGHPGKALHGTKHLLVSELGARPFEQAEGEVDGDGIPDLILGAPAGDPPTIRIHRGSDGSLLENITVYSPGFTGGVRVAAGDLDGDGRVEIIAAPGPGPEEEVRVFDGRTLTLRLSFLPYLEGWRNGIFVACGRTTPARAVSIVTGSDRGGGPHVKIYSARGEDLFGFMALDPDLRTGVRVRCQDANADGVEDLLILPGDPAAGPAGLTGRILDGEKGTLLHEVEPARPSLFSWWHVCAERRSDLLDPARARAAVACLRLRIPLDLGVDPRRWLDWIQVGTWMDAAIDHPAATIERPRDELPAPVDPAPPATPTELLAWALDRVARYPADSRTWLELAHVLRTTGSETQLSAARRIGLDRLPVTPWPEATGPAWLGFLAAKGTESDRWHTWVRGGLDLRSAIQALSPFPGDLDTLLAALDREPVLGGLTAVGLGAFYLDRGQFERAESVQGRTAR